MKRVQIGDKFVSEHDPCFIVLEAGATHSGLDAARKLVDVAVESDLIPQFHLLHCVGGLK